MNPLGLSWLDSFLQELGWERVGNGRDRFDANVFFFGPLILHSTSLLAD